MNKVLLNTSSNLVNLMVGVITTFIMAPVYIKAMGNHDYGLWEMLMSIVGQMGMLDIGLRPALSRYAAKYQAENDTESLKQLYASALLYMGLIGILCLVFFWIWAMTYPDIIAPKGSNDVEKYALLLIIFGVSILSLFLRVVSESYLEGLQRYYLKNNINIILRIIFATTVYFTINKENGIILVAGLTVVFSFVRMILFFVLLAQPNYGALYPDLRKGSLRNLGEIFRFGVKSFVQNTASTIESSSDALVIGSILGPSAVPYFSVPASLLNYIRTIGYTLTHAFMPLFSELNATDQKDKIQRIYLFGSKFVAGLMLPSCIGAVIIGAPFLQVWMHGQVTTDKTELIIVFLVIFIGLPTLNPFASRYLTGIGKHGIYAKILPVSAVLNLIVSIVLVKFFGVMGAAVGSSIPVLITTPIILNYSCNSLEISPLTYILKTIAPLLAPNFVMAAVGLALLDYVGANSYLKIFIIIGACAFVYGICFFILSLDQKERRMVLQLFSRKKPVIET